MKTACKNRRYYLREQKADLGKDYWFRYVKTLEKYSEPVLITPNMAKELLSEFSIKKATHPDIIKAMDLDYMNIVISITGKLLVGKIELEALLMHNNKLTALVTFNA